MKVGFQHPDYGIPCIAEWDEEGQTLQFDIEDYDDAEKYYPADAVEDVRKWCMRNSINCDSEDRGNDHLTFLGVKERLEHW